MRLLRQIRLASWVSISRYAFLLYVYMTCSHKIDIVSKCTYIYLCVFCHLAWVTSLFKQPFLIPFYFDMQGKNTVFSALFYTFGGDGATHNTSLDAWLTASLCILDLFYLLPFVFSLNIMPFAGFCKRPRACWFFIKILQKQC